MTYINDFIHYFTLLIFFVLALQSIYLFVFAFAGKLISHRKYPHSKEFSRFVIYIPSYKEDAVIVDTAKAALAIDYPEEKKHVVVIADSLQPTTIETLQQLPIQVIQVVFEKSTKAKALNEALKQTTDDFDYALVLDADNVCDKNFLYRINDVFQSGFKVVQGQRVAKNTNTSFALLDAISEGINNHIFRKGHTALGFSCAIIGSGMALDFSLFKQIMPEITAVGGFDKEMELRLLRKRFRFGYAEEAIVYDEKITQQSTFENQRRRWLSAQFHYMRRYLADGFIQLLKGNFDFFDKVIQTLLLPRILMLGIMPIAAFLSLLPGPSLQPVYWFTIWLITYTAIIISVPSKYVTKDLGKAIIQLPSAFAGMAKLFFKLKGANKTFIHTPHGDTNTADKK